MERRTRSPFLVPWTDYTKPQSQRGCGTIKQGEFERGFGGGRVHACAPGAPSGEAMRLSHKTRRSLTHVLVLPKHVFVPPVLPGLVHPHSSPSFVQEVCVCNTLFGGVWHVFCKQADASVIPKRREQSEKQKCVILRTLPRSCLTGGHRAHQPPQLFSKQGTSLPRPRGFGVSVSLFVLMHLQTLPFSPTHPTTTTTGQTPPAKSSS